MMKATIKTQTNPRLSAMKCDFQIEWWRQETMSAISDSLSSNTLRHARRRNVSKANRLASDRNAAFR
jgi:hypothetical protein